MHFLAAFGGGLVGSSIAIIVAFSYYSIAEKLALGFLWLYPATLLAVGFLFMMLSGAF